MMLVQYIEQMVEYLAPGFGYPCLAAAFEHRGEVSGYGLSETFFVHHVSCPDAIETFRRERRLAPVFHHPFYARDAVEEFVDLRVFQSLRLIVHGCDIGPQPFPEQGREAQTASHVEALLALYVVLHFSQPAGQRQRGGPYLVPVRDMVFRAFLFSHLFPQLVHIGAADMPDIAAGLEYAVEGGIGFHGISFVAGWRRVYTLAVQE